MNSSIDSDPHPPPFRFDTATDFDRSPSARGLVGGGHRHRLLRNQRTLSGERQVNLGKRPFNREDRIPGTDPEPPSAVLNSRPRSGRSAPNRTEAPQGAALPKWTLRPAGAYRRVAVNDGAQQISARDRWPYARGNSAISRPQPRWLLRTAGFGTGSRPGFRGGRIRSAPTLRRSTRTDIEPGQPPNGTSTQA